MFKLFFTGTTTIILILALVRQAIFASRKQNSKEDDKFIYTFFVAITFALMNLGVI